ncbi:DUF4253 domain-containing protein [Spirillospora sp. NPDC047279]|uniref:DUF4253 domain-containing protein n=1 Tax=Spirillospora sp. NPDC047279 TaxID=3155478 RepID=UPI0033E3C421
MEAPDLEVAVAGPPKMIEDARRVADEHLAFCPDNVWQGPGDYEAYVSLLVEEGRWRFWWD